MTAKQQDRVRGIRREGAEQDAVLRALGAAFGGESCPGRVCGDGAASRGKACGENVPGLLEEQ